MKKYYFLIIVALILGLVLTGCSLLSNISQVPTTGQKGMPSSTANLVSLWHFDEGSGTTVADSNLSNGNDGTISGVPDWVDGRLGKALNFDGSLNSVDCGNEATLQMVDNLTVEAWVYWTGETGSYDTILARGGHVAGGFSVTIRNNLDEIWIFKNGGSDYFTTGLTLNKNEWNHIAVVKYANDELKVYLNAGTPATTTGFDISTPVSDLSVRTGFWDDYWGGGHRFNGIIDEVRIWDGALTAFDIEYSYANDILHVADDWDQYPGAYKTINEALAVAVDGDTISVKAGTYTDDIFDGSLSGNDRYRIKNSIILLGAQAGVDPAGNTDRGGETILVRTNGTPYSLYVSDITIDGFMFGSSDPNTGGRLVISDFADNTIIRNCIIQNTPSASSGHGVYIYPGADNALIEYNTFYNTGWEAIASWQVSGAVITHNYISQSGQHAIQMMGHAGTDNEISYNHISGIVDKNAIQYWGGPGATISHNVIDGGYTMYDGIWLDSAADGSTVSDNEIFDTIFAGINIRGGCTGAIVTYNDVTGCGTGVETHVGATGALVNYNNIAGNSWGVSNYDSGILNATCNWWGDFFGPSGEGPGSGDAVSTNVDFQPWLLNSAPESVCGIGIKLDIKPQSCPNPLNVKSKGVLPVAILGTAYFDVTQVDPSTILLEGKVVPLRWSFEDVAAPSGDLIDVNDPDCSLCSDEGPDGYPDLVLKFDTQAVVDADAISDAEDGECVILTLTGKLDDDTFIMGKDVVRILKKGKK